MGYKLPEEIFTKKVQFTFCLGREDRGKTVVDKMVWIAAQNGAEIAQKEIAMAVKKEMNRIGEKCSWVSWYVGLVHSPENNPDEIVQESLFDLRDKGSSDPSKQRKIAQEAVCESIPPRV